MLKLEIAMASSVRISGGSHFGGSTAATGSRDTTSMRTPHRQIARNAVRLQLHALAYNLGNFVCTLATPEAIRDWSLTSLREKLIKIGAKVVSYGRYIAFQMAEVAISRHLFGDILRLIATLRAPPIPATAT
jgi:hypothetical protein